jgi:hypothetical protein
VAPSAVARNALHARRKAASARPRPAAAHGVASDITDHKDNIFFATIELMRMPMLVTNARQHDHPIISVTRSRSSTSSTEHCRTASSTTRNSKGSEARGFEILREPYDLPELARRARMMLDEKHAPRP